MSQLQVSSFFHQGKVGIYFLQKESGFASISEIKREMSFSFPLKYRENGEYFFVPDFAEAFLAPHTGNNGPLRTNGKCP